MFESYDRIKSKLKFEDNILSIFSLGLFVKYGFETEQDDKVTTVFKDPIFETRKSYIEVITGLMFLSIIITLIGSIILRRKLLKQANKVDPLHPDSFVQGVMEFAGSPFCVLEKEFELAVEADFGGEFNGGFESV